MPITSNQISDILFKKLLGKSTSDNNRQFFEEPNNARPFVDLNQIWAQSNLIPSTASEIPNIVTQIVALQLVNVPGTPTSFTHTDLKNIIPFNYGDGVSYNYTLTTAAGVNIPFGTNEWLLDTETGTLTFFGPNGTPSLPSGVTTSNGPKITCWKYIGKNAKELGGIGSGNSHGIGEWQDSIIDFVDTLPTSNTQLDRYVYNSTSSLLAPIYDSILDSVSIDTLQPYSIIEWRETVSGSTAGWYQTPATMGMFTSVDSLNNKIYFYNTNTHWTEFSDKIISVELYLEPQSTYVLETSVPQILSNFEIETEGVENSDSNLFVNGILLNDNSYNFVALTEINATFISYGTSSDVEFDFTSSINIGNQLKIFSNGNVIWRAIVDVLSDSTVQYAGPNIDIIDLVEVYSYQIHTYPHEGDYVLYTANNIYDITGESSIDDGHIDSLTLEYNITEFNFDLSAIDSGITHLNGLSDPIQTFEITNNATSLSWISTNGVHTLNIPNATTTRNGLISTSTQTFKGNKIFNDGIKVGDKITIATDTGFSYSNIDYNTEVSDGMYMYNILNDINSQINYHSIILGDSFVYDADTDGILSISNQINVSYIAPQYIKSPELGLLTNNNFISDIDTDYLRIISTSDNILSIRLSNTDFNNNFIFNATTNRSYTLPDESGILALVSQIPTFSLNGLIDLIQTFNVVNSGVDLNWSSTSGVHTLNIPNASSIQNGFMSTGTQTFNGTKTFSGVVNFDNYILLNSTIGMTITDSSNYPDTQLTLNSGDGFKYTDSTFSNVLSSNIILYDNSLDNYLYADTVSIILEDNANGYSLDYNSIGSGMLKISEATSYSSVSPFGIVSNKYSLIDTTEKVALDVSASNTLRVGWNFSTITYSSSTTQFTYSATGGVSHNLAGGALQAGIGFRVGRTSNLTHSSGVAIQLATNGTFASSSGNGDWYQIYMNPSYNQIGTATGTMRGIYYNPTIGSILGEHYAFEATSGIVKIGDTTDSTSSTNGAMQIAGGLSVGKKAYIVDRLNIGEANSGEVKLTLTGGTTGGGLSKFIIGQGTALTNNYFGLEHNGVIVFTIPNTTTLQITAGVSLRGGNGLVPLNIIGGGGGSGGANGIVLLNGSGALGAMSHISGTANFVTIGENTSTAYRFVPSSGTGVLNMLAIRGRYNQTGTASGSIRGIFYDPVIDNIIGNHYAFEATSGIVKIGDTSASISSSTGALQVAGGAYFGSSTVIEAPTITPLAVSGNSSAGTVSLRLYNSANANSNNYTSISFTNKNSTQTYKTSNVVYSGFTTLTDGGEISAYIISGYSSGTLAERFKIAGNLTYITSNNTSWIFNSNTLQTVGTNASWQINGAGGSGITLSSTNATFNIKTSGSTNTNNRAISFDYANAQTWLGTEISLMLFNQTVNTTSGGSAYNSINISPTITRAGFDTGITRGIYYNPTISVLGIHYAFEATSGIVKISDTTSSTSVDTGALIVSGGIGIGGNLYNSGIANFANGVLNVSTSRVTARSIWPDLSSRNLGDPSAIWSSSFTDNVYVKTAVKILNIGSSETNQASYLNALDMQGAGYLRLGINFTSLQMPQYNIIHTNSIVYSQTNSAGTITFQTTGGSLSNHNGIVFTRGANLTSTSGTTNIATVLGTFSPISGDGIFNSLSISPTFNQTSTASGRVRGIYYNPTITNILGEHYAFESTNGDMLVGGSGKILLNNDGTAKTALESPTSNQLRVGSGFSNLSLPPTVYLSGSLIAGISTSALTLQTLGGTSVNNGVIVSRTTSVASTSGLVRVLTVSSTFAPTSGDAEFNSLSISPTYNQTGTASGTVRGIYYNPTITNILGNHYAFEATSGKVKLGDQLLVANGSTSIPSYSFTNSPNTGLCWDTTDNRIILSVNGNSRISFYQSGNIIVSGTFTMANSNNIAFGTVTGTKIGSANTQLFAFWGATPTTQPTTSVSSATVVSNSGTNINDATTFDGYTMAQIVKALRNIGLLA